MRVCTVCVYWMCGVICVGVCTVCVYCVCVLYVCVCTLVLASMGAPLSRSSSTAGSCPLLAAQCSGVRPSCDTHTHTHTLSHPHTHTLSHTHTHTHTLSHTYTH